MQIQKINFSKTKNSAPKNDNTPSFGLKISPNMQEDIFQGTKREFQRGTVSIFMDKLSKMFDDTYSVTSRIVNKHYRKDRYRDAVEILLEKENSPKSPKIITTKFFDENKNEATYEAFTRMMKLPPEEIKKAAGSL